MSGYRWTILALGAAAQGSYSAIFLGLPVLAPALRDEYGLGLTEIGVVLAAANLGSVATLLLWGLAADRIGERIVLSGGLLIAAGALVGAAFASGYAELVAAVTVAGAAGASVNAASGRAVMGWFAPAERGFALALRQTSNPLGGVAAAVALPPIAAVGGAEAGLLALAGACVLTATAGGVGLREAPGAHPEVGPHVVHPLRDSRIWRVSAGSGLVVVAQMSILSFTVLFLHEERGLSTGTAAAVLAAMQAAGAALRLASGRWSDRLGVRIRPLLRLCFAFSAALALSGAVAAAPLAVLVPALFIAGALSQSWNGLSFTATAELAGRARSGAALGFQQTSLALASAGAAPAFASTVEASSWGVAFGLAALLPLAGAGLFRRIPV